MATIRALMELTPAELRSKPAIRNFGPWASQQAVCFGWFKWFWLGRAQDSAHTLLIGPFWTKRGAKRAWGKVPTQWSPPAPEETHTRSLQTGTRFPN